jgi:hypothetical protein
MLLVLTPIAKAQDCAQTIQQVTSEEIHVAANSTQALARLRVQEYVAVLIDQAFLETESVESYVVLEHIGAAVPVQVNFAINSIDRVAHELRTALVRHKRAFLLLRNEAQRSVRDELKDGITALLLSCTMALQVPDLQCDVETRVRTVYELAQAICRKLDGGCANESINIGQADSYTTSTI